MGSLALVGVAIIFTLFGVFINYNAIMFGDIFQVVARNALGLLIVVPIIFWKRIRFQFTTREWYILALYSLVSVVAFVTVSQAYLEAPIKTVLATRYTIMVVASAFIAMIFFGERLQTKNYTAVLLALAGIFVFAYPLNSFLEIGVLYAATASVAFLTMNAIIKKVQTAPEVLMACEFVTVVALLGAFMIISGSPTITTFNTFSLSIMLLFGFLLVAVTYMMVYGFRNTHFNIANVILTSEIAFGLLFGYVLLGQGIETLQWIGIFLIALAVTLPHLLMWSHQRKSLVQSSRP